MDPPTREALEEAVSGLDHLSAERVREELIKVLASPEPSATLHLYRDTRALSVWYPELETHADEPAWDEALAAIDKLKRHREYLRLCQLLLILPSDPSIEPLENPGFIAAGTLLKRLKFSCADQRRVLHLYQHFLPFISPVDSSAQIREWLSEIGPGMERDLFRLHYAAACAAQAEDSTRALVFVRRRVHEERRSGAPIDRADLVLDGNDVLDLGVPRGPLVGLLLDELHSLVLEDPDLNTRDKLLAKSRELIDMAGLVDSSAEPEVE
jgi:tRNA nucleotidyltransferase/poly(A) polymerase